MIDYKKKLFRNACIVYWLNAVLMGPTWAGPQVIEIEPVLVTGQPVPELMGQTFVDPDRPGTNNSGQTVLTADTAAGAEGVWAQLEPGGDFVKLLLQGDPVPGYPDLTFSNTNTYPLGLSKSGIVAHRYGVVRDGARGEILNAFIASNVNDRSVSVVALEGESAPGTATQYRWARGSTLRDSSDRLTLVAALVGIGTEFDADALYLVAEKAAEPSLLVLAGETAPGADGAVFSAIYGADVNGSRLAFDAKLAGNAVDESNDRGIWFGSPSQGGQDLILREGQRVPETGDELVFSALYDLTVFDDGGVGVNAAAIGPGLSFGQTVDIFVDSDTREISKIAFAGDPVPGIEGAVFQHISGADFSSAGHAVFWARLEGADIDLTNNLALFMATQGGVELVARSGVDFRPGFRDGRFQQVNRRGQIAFTASDDVHNYSLYVTLPDGTLVELLNSGDTLDVLGEPRTVSLISLGYGNRGVFDSFSDDGTLTFHVYFDNNTTGIYRAITLTDSLFEDDFEGAVRSQ